MLSYEFVSPSHIRSSRMQDLLWEWNGARNGEVLPLRDAFTREALGAAFDWMTHIEVEDAHHRPRFKIAEHGARVGEMYGAVCHGKYLDEILPPGKRAAALESYLKILEKKSPIYTLSESGSDGDRVTEERLMLPLGHPILGVTRIWVMIEPSTHARKLEWRNLMARAAVPAFLIKAAIDPAEPLLYRG